mgnify:CR=1 FL=1
MKNNNENNNNNNTSLFAKMDNQDVIKMLIKNNTMLTESVNKLTESVNQLAHENTLLHAKLDNPTLHQTVYQTPPALHQPIPSVIYQASSDIMELDKFIDIVKEEIEETTKLVYFDLDKPNKNILCEKVAGVIESVYNKIEIGNKPFVIIDAKREQVEYKSGGIILDDDVVFELLLKLEKQFREQQLKLFKRQRLVTEFAAFYRILSQDISPSKFKKLLMKFITKK